MRTVDLNESEVVLCSRYAAQQICFSRSRGATRHHGGSSSRRLGGIFGDYVLGIMAELAVSKYLGMEFKPPVLGDYESADLGGVCEVKASDHPKSGLLIYKSQQHDEKLYTHVRFDGFTAQFKGWIFGKEAKGPMVWKPKYDTPCYRLDTKYLNPIETMPMDGRRFVKERR